MASVDGLGSTIGNDSCSGLGKETGGAAQALNKRIPITRTDNNIRFTSAF